MRYEGRYGGIKGEAWNAVKRYIRKKERDCYTCPAKNLKGSNAQAGHFIQVSKAGNSNSLSWDERQIHLQCANCNGYGEGRYENYRMHLVRDYGESVVLEFEQRRWRVDKVGNWQAVIDHYNKLYEEL